MEPEQCGCGDSLAIRGVLFDLFGTVVAYGDIAEGTRLAWEGIYDVLQRLGGRVPFDAFAREWQAQFLMPLQPHEHVAGETPFVSKLLRQFAYYGLPRDRVAAREAAERCLAGWDAHTLLPEDTVPTLQALRTGGYRLALVTNFDHPPYVHSLLGQRGLDGLFDAVIISGEVGCDKPDAAIFRLALARLGLAPQEALFVGDSLDADIAGAYAAGCVPVLIDMRFAHPDYVGARITRLSQVLALLSERAGPPR